MCELPPSELAIECGHLRHEIECLQKLVADLRAAKERLEAKIEEIEAEHGQELQGMRSFSMDLEVRLEEAEKAARQEANRANNAALRAERNALRIKELVREATMNCNPSPVFTIQLFEPTVDKPHWQGVLVTSTGKVLADVRTPGIGRAMALLEEILRLEVGE